MALTSEELSRVDNVFVSDQDDPVFRRLDEEFARPDINSSLEIASKRNPDDHAENLRLAKSTDLPIDTVARNKEEINRREGLKHLDLAGYKKLEQYFADPDNASVSIDDTEPLKKLEDAATGKPGSPPEALIKQWVEGTVGVIESMKNILPETEEQLKQQMRGRFAGLYRAGGLKAATTPPPMWEPIPREDQFRPEIFQAQEERKVELDKRTETAVNDLMAEIESGEKKIEELTPKDLNLWQQGLRGGAVSAMLQGPVIVGSLVTGQPWLGPVLMGEQVFAESFGSAQAKGMDIPESLAYAGGQAGFEYIGEKLPFKHLENLFKRAGDTTGEFFRYMGKEVAGEEITAVGQGAIDYIAGMDEEMEAAIDSGDYQKAWGIATDRAFVTAIAAVTGSGIQAGSIAALGKTVEMVAAGKTQTRNWGDILSSLEGQERLDRLIEAAQETKTLPRSPERFDTLLQSFGDQSIYLTQEAAAELQDPPDYILEQMSDYGSDIEIPLNRFTADLASDPETMKVIRPHIRISDSGFTVNELETGDTDTLRNILTKAQQNAEVKAEADQIFESLIPQLVATGRMSESTARTSAAIIPAYLTTYVDRARKKGDDISISQVYEQFFQGQGLRIVGPGVKPKDVTDKPEETILDQIPASPYAQKQDFGDIVTEDRRPSLEDPGAMTTVRMNMQKQWDSTQKRRDQLTKMVECLQS